MTIKQQGGIFGRNPTFNDLDIDNNLTISGDVSIEGTTDAKLINVDLDAEAKGVIIKKNGSEIGSLRILDSNKLAIAGEGSTFGGFCFNNNGRIVPVYNGDRVDNAVDLGQSAGPLRFKNLHLSGNVYLASGAGIDFSATSDASGSTSELFDDYEEGTWTPADNSGAGLSFSSVVATYTKTGRMVVANYILTFPTTADGTTASISGLPFSANSLGNYQGGMVQWANAGADLSHLISSGTGNFGVRNNSNGTDYTNANLSGKTLRATLVYFV